MDNASPRVTFSSSWLSVDISPFSDSFVIDEGVSLTTELAGDTETWNQESKIIPRETTSTNHFLMHKIRYAEILYLLRFHSPEYNADHLG